MTLQYFYQEKRLDIVNKGDFKKGRLEVKRNYLNKLFSTLHLRKEDIIKLDIKEEGFSDSHVDLLVEIIYNEDDKETDEPANEYDPSQDVRPLIRSWINEDTVKATKTCLNTVFDFTAGMLLSAIKKRK